MENVEPIQEGTYVIGVSGGVDSVVLLDMLAEPHSKFIVAHFDHGIRAESRDDERFVVGLAEKYGLEYETERQELGPEASEATARQARYAFLRRARDKHKATAIITAHHQDDVIETMMINLIRGTGWRGLCSLKSTATVIRPLLSVTKAEIITYAKAHQLAWRDDTTNSDERYLRNAVRRHLLPHANKDVWRELYENQKQIQAEIDSEIARLRSLSRYDYIMWPVDVALEMIKRETGVTRIQAEAALMFVKTGHSGSSMAIGDKKKLALTRDDFFVTPLKT